VAPGEPLTGGRRGGALAEQLPGPANLWIRHLPRGWPRQAFPWVNLARAGLAMRRPATGPPPEAPPLEDLLWVPPVGPAEEPWRDRWVERGAAAGVPVLVQLLPGQEAPRLAGVFAVYDLLDALLRGDLAALAGLPPGSTAVWPLVAGITSAPELVARGCERLAAAGVTAVQALALDLDPAARRELAARGGDAVFDRLFHAPPASERSFARAAHRHGLRPFAARPPLPGGERPDNRRLAEVLALAAELWLRSERPAGRGGELYRAARWVDRSPYDLARLWREGNLAVVSWLDGESRELVAEVCATGRCALLDALLAEYLDGPGVTA
jgi:hypothetical protein